MYGNEANKTIPEGPITKAARQIANYLLILYACCLVLILVAAIYQGTSNNNVWFDLFKSGFLLLGGALTTVIGYYFGSRGIQEAEASVAIALQEAEKAKKNLEDEKKRLGELEEKAAPTFREDELQKPPTNGGGV